MTTHTLYRRIIQYVTLLLLSSCTVYAPMQPTISTVHSRGQAEVTASIQPSGRVEGSMVYSPLPHTLVMAAGTFRPKLSDSAFFRTRQWEAGMGTYWSLGRGWTVTGIGGLGYASSYKAYRPFNVLGGTPALVAYGAKYSKLFGQGGLTKELVAHSFGLVYRLNRLQFDRLDYLPSRAKASVSLPAEAMIRHEVVLFFRGDLDRAKRWQAQFAMGLSVDGKMRPIEYEPATVYDDEQTRHLVPMASLGVVFRPQLRRQQ